MHPNGILCREISVLGQKVLTLIKIEMLFGGISDYLLLSPEWEGISNSVQRSVLVRGRENQRTSGARGWEEGGAYKSSEVQDQLYPIPCFAWGWSLEWNSILILQLKAQVQALTANRDWRLGSRWKLPGKENISTKSEQRAERYFRNRGQKDFLGQGVKRGSQETTVREPRVAGRRYRTISCFLTVGDKTHKMLCVVLFTVIAFTFLTTPLQSGVTHFTWGSWGWRVGVPYLSLNLGSGTHLFFYFSLV